MKTRTIKKASEVYRSVNEECARIIAANPLKYPDGSLMFRWANLVLTPTERTRPGIRRPV